MIKIAVLDYDIGNIRSICAALEKVGSTPRLTRNMRDIMEADGLVLPGVGAFPHGMRKLKEFSLDRLIKDFAATNKPLLGICLGMQMLLSYSDEFCHTQGLGLIPGSVRKLSSLNVEESKLPYVSWSELQRPEDTSWNGTVLEGVTPKENMYFVHSFMAVPNNKNHVLSYTNYSGSQFCSSVKKGNVYGCQFHPEKSAETGLKILSNFTRLC